MKNVVAIGYNPDKKVVILSVPEKAHDDNFIIEVKEELYSDFCSSIANLKPGKISNIDISFYREGCLIKQGKKEIFWSVPMAANFITGVQSGTYKLEYLKQFMQDLTKKFEEDPDFAATVKGKTIIVTKD